MKKSMCVVFAFISGCSFNSKFTGGGLGSPSSSPSSSSSSSSSDPARPPGDPPRTAAAITPASDYVHRIVPDLRGKTLEQAKATMQAAGFNVGSYEPSEGDCSYDSDKQMVKPGTVCEQRPGVGVDTTTRIYNMTLRVEIDSYAASRETTGSRAWRRMPDVVGKSLADATAILAKAGLPLDANFEIAEAEQEGCAPGHVCATNPEAAQRKRLQGAGTIYIGKAAPPAETPTAPNTPTTTGSTTYF